MVVVEKVSYMCINSVSLSDNIVAAASAPPFAPAKLEHSEQIELGYLPLRDDFDRVNYSIWILVYVL